MSHQPVGIPCNCNRPGWMPGIEHVPPIWQYMIESLTGVAPGNMRPIIAVDHIMQGWQTTMIRYAQELNPERRVVATFTIGREGRAIQHLSLFDPGRHTGSIRQSTWARLSSAPSINRGADPWSISWEHEGFSVAISNTPSILAATWTPQNPWPEKMVEASLRTKIWAWRNAPTLQQLGPPSVDTLVGHYLLDGLQRPEDPSRPATRGVWPHQRFITGLREALGSSGGGGVPAVSNAYIVGPGDNLSSISARTGISVANLVAWNEIANQNLIFIGQVLKLRADAPRPAAATQADLAGLDSIATQVSTIRNRLTPK